MEYNNKKIVFILDVDGVVTPGNFHYSKDGKIAKEFGCDDYDMLNELGKSIPFHFITADKKGFPITQKRLEEDCGYQLDLVSGKPNERLVWIWENYPRDKYCVIFMGDGCNDFQCLMDADYSITTCDALEHTQSCASYVTTRKGGNRAVAEAVLHIMKKFNIRWAWDEYFETYQEVLLRSGISG